MGKRIGFIGSGKMAETIAKKLLTRITPETRFCYKKQRLISNLVASDPSAERRKIFNSMGIKTTTDNSQVLADCDMVFLAVRPEDTIGAIESMKWRNSISAGKLVVSLVGGMPAIALESILGSGAKVVRMMPNQVFSGNDVSCGTYYGASATEDDVNEVVELLGDSAHFFAEDESIPQSLVLAANLLGLDDKGLGHTITKDDDRCFNEKYTLGPQIGQGTFASIYKAYERESGRLFAVKCVKTSGDISGYDGVVAEVAALNTLKHQNIIELHDFHSEADQHYLILDYLSGGSLQDRIEKCDRFSEGDAKVILRQLVSALAYSHSMGCVHRDIKAENVMLESSNSLKVKLMDFGFCKQLTDGSDRLHRSCGTIGYACPEMLSGLTYGTPADVWSLGVLSYILVSGIPPFYHKDENVLKKLIKHGEVKLSGEVWDAISPQCKDFIMKMLVTDQSQRVSAVALLSHPWLQ